MMVRSLAATAMCVCLASAAQASVATELAAIDKTLNACIDKDSSNAGMATCTGDADQAADKVLQRTYSAIVAKLKSATGDEVPDAKEKLKRLIAAERAWIAFRDANCNLQGIEMLGGSGEGLSIEGCQYTATRDRAKALDELFSDK